MAPYDELSANPRHLAGTSSPHGDESDSPAAAPRHQGAPGPIDRRKIFGIIASGALASACTVKLGPGIVDGPLNSAAGALGLGGTKKVSPVAGEGPVTGMKNSSNNMGTSNKMENMGNPKTPATTGQGEIGSRPPKPSTGAGLTQPSTPLDLDQSMHLARRAFWGPTAALVAEIKKAGTAWIDQQLKPSSIPDGACDALVGRYPTAGQSYAAVKAMAPGREKENHFFDQAELQFTTIIRAAWSNRQLLEVLVDFFHDRLHIPAWHAKTRLMHNDYDTNVIRKHAVGSFGDMVQAMVLHPGMLSYLDNNENTKDGGNQNLGRELLELHTLGIDAGYTQADVEGAAKSLTGISAKDGKLEFNPGAHSYGSVKVFGKTYSNATGSDGIATLKKLVYDLTRSPACAEYFCLDLARKFVADAPPKVLVDRLAKTYLANDTEIAPVVKQLLTSPEFRASVGQKYRRPMENLVATIRVLGLKLTGNNADVGKTMNHLIRANLKQMGQPPMERSSPDGYPDFARPWLSTVGTLSRWNVHTSLVGHWHQGLTEPDIQQVLAKANTYGEAVSELGEWLLLQKLTAREMDLFLTFLGKSASEPLTAENRKNDYNLRARLPSLILGAPQHQLR